MVTKKTYIITIAIMLIAFIIAFVAYYFYSENKIQEILNEKDLITIVPQNQTSGLSNIIAE